MRDEKDTSCVVIGYSMMMDDDYSHVRLNCTASVFTVGKTKITMNQWLQTLFLLLLLNPNSLLTITGHYNHNTIIFQTMAYPSCQFKVRTVTAFVALTPSDFSEEEKEQPVDTLFRGVERKILTCARVLSEVKGSIEQNGYEVQTVRIAFNPFGEWLVHSSNDGVDRRLERLELVDDLLSKYDIQFCSLGPAMKVDEVEFCENIIECSPRMSCSAMVRDGDVETAYACAALIKRISQLESKSFLKGGLGNFRFCTASCCSPFIPFFPGAKGDGSSPGVKFAIGMENGHLAKELLSKAKTISNIPTIFREGFAAAVLPLTDICSKIKFSFSTDEDVFVEYIGCDTSLNPSLEDDGSVAAAIEELKEVSTFGSVGSVAAAAAITTSLQNVPIKRTGYCGLMLPVLEDVRLSELAASTPSNLRISQLLSISNVCGVGVDTVPIPGDCNDHDLSSLILDVAGVAHRWNKSLTCRVFPTGVVNAETQFDSPYMCNSRVFNIS